MCAVSIFLLTAITEWRMIFLTTNLMTNLKRSNMNNRIPEDHWLLMRPIAHRGLHNNEYPENSLAAFWNAVKNDRPIELDVHITKDGHLFVFHDDDAKRMTGADGDVNMMTKNDISQLLLRLPGGEPAGGEMHGEDDHFRCGIPSFDEVLELVAGKVPLLIETKPAMNPGLLEQKLHERLVKYRADYPGCEFAIQSFDVRSVRMIGQMEPDFIRGLLSKNMRDYPLSALKRWLLTGCRLSFYCKPDFIAYKTADLPIGRITGKRRRGMPVLGWTVRSYETQKQAEEYCDNIIFEKYEPVTDM